MTANVLIIVNPHANSGGAAQRHADSARNKIDSNLHKLPDVSGVEWMLTDYPRHATELARSAAEKGYRYIFAAGGDGTISEVVNGLMQQAVHNSIQDPARRPVLGVLPWGTLNDFYMALVEAEATQAESGITQPLDVGYVRMDSFEAYCCLSISAGLSSWANLQYQQASIRFGRLFAALPAAVTTLLTYRRSPGITLTLDENSPQFRRMLAIAISNCPSVGGGVRLTPDAKIDDGLFDVGLIKEVSLIRLAMVLGMARLRRHFRASALDVSRARTIRIGSPQPLSVHLDGELIPLNQSEVKTIQITVLPHALQVIRPSRIRLNE